MNCVTECEDKAKIREKWKYDYCLECNSRHYRIQESKVSGHGIITVINCIYLSPYIRRKKKRPKRSSSIAIVEKLGDLMLAWALLSQISVRSRRFNRERDQAQHVWHPFILSPSNSWFHQELICTRFHQVLICTPSFKQN